jgi:glycosyltransferase involved in cell wall biosynthesis
MFTVVTPHLNQLAELKKCVGSVRGQNIADHLTHIVEDGESDAATHTWAQAQPDLVFNSQPDKSPYQAIERGWNRERGTILSWLNADEQYLPGTLPHIEDIFLKYDPDIVVGDTIIVDHAGAPTAYRKTPPLRCAYIASSYLYALSCSTFFNQRLFVDGRLRFNPAFRYAADMELMLRLLRSGASVHYTPRPLSLFAIGESNLSRSETMTTETVKIQDMFTACRRKFPRPFWNTLRLIEKTIHGCYTPRYTSYQYAIDDVPTYRTEAKRLTHQFRFP